LPRHFPYVIVDLPSGYREVTLETFEVCDRLLAIVAPDIAALKGLRALLDVLEQLRIPQEKLGLILNQPAPGVSLSRGDVERRSGLSLLAGIPCGDDGFRAAYDRGTPVVKLLPQNPSSQAIRRLSE